MLKKDELHFIVGGAFNFNSTFLNSAVRGFNTILDLGRTVGTAIRMLISGKRC